MDLECLMKEMSRIMYKQRQLKKVIPSSKDMDKMIFIRFIHRKRKTQKLDKGALSHCYFSRSDVNSSLSACSFYSFRRVAS